MPGLEIPVGLQAEVVEVYEQLGDRPATELLAGLNTPARIQKRGFPVRADHLVAVIIDSYRANDRTRFALYDFDMDELATSRVYTKETYKEANEDADQLDNVTIVRFET